MKQPKRIRILQCTATGDSRYDELIGQTVSTIGSKSDHYIIDEFRMIGSWAVYIEVRKSDCKLLRKSKYRGTSQPLNQEESNTSKSKKQRKSL